MSRSFTRPTLTHTQIVREKSLNRAPPSYASHFHFLLRLVFSDTETRLVGHLYYKSLSSLIRVIMGANASKKNNKLKAKDLADLAEKTKCKRIKT